MARQSGDVSVAGSCFRYGRLRDAWRNAILTTLQDEYAFSALYEASDIRLQASGKPLRLPMKQRLCSLGRLADFASSEALGHQAE
jgi:hypothetical protein